MNLSLELVVEGKKSDGNQFLLNFKSPRSNGLILNIHHRTSKKSGRFIYFDFHPNANILAIASQDGDLYFIDFLNSKYWGFSELGTCSFIKFSEYNLDEILVAQLTREIKIINITTADTVAVLQGHTVTPSFVSFTDNYLCLTSSQNEGIIWNLTTNMKLQVLSLEKDNHLKFVKFIPVSGHILACFTDDIIQVWKKDTYETLKQFDPSNWNNYSVKCMDFSRNGRIMVVGGYVPNLAVFLVDKWKVIKLIKLPEYILTVKGIEFVCQNFDGGSNQLLAVLSGKGILHFYDIKNNLIISELQSQCEINKFGISPAGDKAVCLLCSGEVEIYDLTQYVSTSSEDTVVQASQKTTNKKLTWRYSNKKAKEYIKDQIEDVLDDQKLRLLLHEYGQFPESCRLKIWTKLLCLPDNVRQYTSIINHVTVIAFEDLYSRFPLENKAVIGCLRRLLNNIVTWCPFFANIEYLPLFTFPFVKMFHVNPIATFEVVCSIILNWCQHWFEYYPLVPVNVLAIIENIIMEHDPDLLQFLAINNVTSNIFAWSLLETAFSEVLTTPEWLQFWDHVLVNEPSFLYCAVAAFNVCQRKQIATRKSKEEFVLFFHSQNPLNMKQFIAKTYYILNTTSEKLHPRQYLSDFKSIGCCSYPEFYDYPKTVIELEKKQIGDMENELRDIQCRQQCLEKQRSSVNEHLKEHQVQREQQRRLFAMKSAVMEKLQCYKQAIKTQQAKLKDMRQELIQEEKEIVDHSRQQLNELKSRKQEYFIENLGHELTLNTTSDEINLLKAEDDILRHRLELLRNRKDNLSSGKEQVGRAAYELSCERCVERGINNEVIPLKNAESRKVKIVKRIADMENVIRKIESELHLETIVKDALRNNKDKSLKTLKLHQETKELRKDVSKLLEMLSRKKSKSNDTLELANTGHSSITLTKNVRFTTTTGSSSSSNN